MDLEWNLVSDIAMKHNFESMIRWRRQKRAQLNLAPDPSLYPTGACYAQPQREDWPVYDSAGKCYVDWSDDRKDMESMLELPPSSSHEI